MESYRIGQYIGRVRCLEMGEGMKKMMGTVSVAYVNHGKNDCAKYKTKKTWWGSDMGLWDLVECGNG